MKRKNKSNKYTGIGKVYFFPNKVKSTKQYLKCLLVFLGSFLKGEEKKIG